MKDLTYYVGFEPYEKLTLSNFFIFGKVMGILKNSREMVRRLTGNQLGAKAIVTNEQSVQIAIDGKSVRYDIHILDLPVAIYDVEMQRQNNKAVLPKRARYYQDIIDLLYLENSAEYAALPMNYVLFICRFDPFGLGLTCYDFENVCLNTPDSVPLKLGDDRKILIFNTKGKIINVSEEAWKFLNYIETGTIGDDYTMSLDREVSMARKNREWRGEYMIMSCNIADALREGREEGIVDGVAQALRDTARKMKNKGASPEFIMDTTGLTLEDIEKL